MPRYENGENLADINVLKSRKPHGTDVYIKITYMSRQNGTPCWNFIN